MLPDELKLFHPPAALAAWDAAAVLGGRLDRGEVTISAAATLALGIFPSLALDFALRWPVFAR